MLGSRRALLNKIDGSPCVAVALVTSITLPVGVEEKRQEKKQKHLNETCVFAREAGS